MTKGSQPGTGMALDGFSAMLDGRRAPSPDRSMVEVMPLTWFAPMLSALAAMLLPAGLLHAALQNPAEAPGQASLVGQILVASPGLRDPRFDHTVVLVVRHSS